jgi:hypothetical protein
MEIHAPDQPITGWKQTVKHLAIITAGILIALSLEGIVAWADHRMLVREAVANLTAELRNNKKELDGLFANIERELKQLENADDVAQKLLRHETLEKVSLELTTHSAELKNAAVTTGQITGAFGYMEYSEVSRYASVYDLQAQFMRLQERDSQNFLQVLSFVGVGLNSKPTDAATQEWRARISTAQAALGVKEQVARQLLKRYEEMLAETR